MSLDLGGTNAQAPLEALASVDELVAFLRSGEKPASQWRIGVEHEKIGFTKAMQPIAYAGEAGIRALLEKLAADGVGKLHLEAGNPIAVLSGNASITLEPGGQLELSGAPFRSLADAGLEIERHLQEVAAASGPGVTWAMLGYRPYGNTASGEWTPKLRYNEMRRSLGPQGRLALDMMLMTATVQANLDWSDEADLAAKSRAATGVSPIVTALFANSPIVDGKDSGYLDYRYQVWRETDPKRCGLLEAMVQPGFGYRSYVDWAIDVPLLFVRHEGKYLDGAGLTFREWMKRGELAGVKLRPNIDNFSDHLTTLFPEVRIKRVLEVRGADVVPMPLMLSLPALWLGLLYDGDAREAAWQLTAKWSWAERLAFQADVARRALAAEGPGGVTALSLGRELIAIAERGLLGWAKESGHDERRFLEPLAELARGGHPLSEKLLSKWKLANRDPAVLIEGAIASAAAP